MIGYGAWEAGGTAWGANESDEVVIEAIRAGLDAGIDWVDTAEVYGDGVSETLVGRALEGRRDEVVVATKVAPEPEGSGFKPSQVREACEKSLGRIGTDRIDLYQLHWPDESGVPLEETWGAMTELQDAGLVRHIGVSNFDQAQIETCLAMRHVDSLQPEFSMLTREHGDLIRWCGEQGIGVISYGPLAYGLLTGAITAETRFRAGDWRGQEPDEGPYADLAALARDRREAPPGGRTARLRAVAPRARLERPPAGGDRGDRGESQPEPRPGQRRWGRPRAGRRDARGARLAPRLNRRQTTGVPGWT